MDKNINWEDFLKITNQEPIKQEEENKHIKNLKQSGEYIDIDRSFVYEDKEKGVKMPLWFKILQDKKKLNKKSI